MKIDSSLTPEQLRSGVHALFENAAPKIRSLDRAFDGTGGAPVFTSGGRYTSRGWTEWTQGFQFGSAILQYDATGEAGFLDIGRSRTIAVMAPHITHLGVHDHGFNNVSTYGNLLRLMAEGRIPHDEWQRQYYILALKCSGAVQAARWTPKPGYIYSFNGPHSLFVDTIRTLRAPALSHALGHSMLGENDVKIPLLGRVVSHLEATAKYAVYYGEGRDTYDIRGRTAHESIFNPNDGNYRCPNSQQGYSPFSTWTRGLAWAMLGFAEQLEFFRTIKDVDTSFMRKAAEATCDFYIENTALDGIPYWDTGAPHLEKLGDWRGRNSDPFTDHEPVDSSAAAIAAQGLLRLGRHLGNGRYTQAGLTVARTLFSDPYLSADANHQGILLHSVYHRPNGWDAIPKGRMVPCGESSMWGDYHALELGLYLQRLQESKPYLTFFGGIPQ